MGMTYAGAATVSSPVPARRSLAVARPPARVQTPLLLIDLGLLAGITWAEMVFVSEWANRAPGVLP